MDKKEKIIEILNKYSKTDLEWMEQFHGKDCRVIDFMDYDKIVNELVSLESQPEEKKEKLSIEGKIAKAKELMWEATREREVVRKILIDNQICQCGHRRNFHAISHSINYTEGFCSECKCEHFILESSIIPIDETGKPNTNGYFKSK
jgi:hypothetical protein